MKTAISSALGLSLLMLGVGCEAPPPEDFGTVMIELQRSPSEATTPYQGTKFIRAFLDYKECLADFYITEQPDWQFDGVAGGEIRDEWMNGRLCDKDMYDKPIPSCTVTEMNQTLNTQGATDITFLSVTYDLSNSDVEGLHLPFGPLPTEHLAGCKPLVTLGGASVQGFDGMDAGIWKIASFENATARVGQGASIQIFVERN